MSNEPSEPIYCHVRRKTELDAESYVAKKVSFDETIKDSDDFFTASTNDRFQCPNIECEGWYLFFGVVHWEPNYMYGRTAWFSKFTKKGSDDNPEYDLFVKDKFLGRREWVTKVDCWNPGVSVSIPIELKKLDYVEFWCKTMQWGYFRPWFPYFEPINYNTHIYSSDIKPYFPTEVRFVRIRRL